MTEAQGRRGWWALRPMVLGLLSSFGLIHWATISAMNQFHSSLLVFDSKLHRSASLSAVLDVWTGPSPTLQLGFYHFSSLNHFGSFAACRVCQAELSRAEPSRRRSFKKSPSGGLTLKCKVHANKSWVWTWNVIVMQRPHIFKREEKKISLDSLTFQHVRFSSSFLIGCFTKLNKQPRVAAQWFD